MCYDFYYKMLMSLFSHMSCDLKFHQKQNTHIIPQTCWKWTKWSSIFEFWHMSSFILFYEMSSHIPWLNDSTLIFFTTYGNTSSFFVQKDHGVMTNAVMTKGPRINILWKIRTKVSQKKFWGPYWNFVNF